MNKQKTIAQQLGITKFPFEIKENGRVVYFENRAKYWVKYQYDKNGNEIRRECSDLYVGNGPWRAAYHCCNHLGRIQKIRGTRPGFGPSVSSRQDRRACA